MQCVILDEPWELEIRRLKLQGYSKKLLRKQYVKHLKYHTTLYKKMDFSGTICINAAQIHSMTGLQKMGKEIAEQFPDFNAFF